MAKKAMYRVFFTNANGESTTDFMMGNPNALIAEREISKLIRKMYGGVLLSIEIWND